VKNDRRRKKLAHFFAVIYNVIVMVTFSKKQSEVGDKE
jgi:hypothetical protein